MLEGIGLQEIGEDTSFQRDGLRGAFNLQLERALVHQWLSDAVVALPTTASAQELNATLTVADRALSWDLVDDPRVGELRGMLLHRLQRFPEAESALLAAFDARGGFDYVQSNIVLAGYAMDPQRRRFDQAQELLDQVLAATPDHPVALPMRQELERRRNQ